MCSGWREVVLWLPGVAGRSLRVLRGSDQRRMRGDSRARGDRHGHSIMVGGVQIDRPKSSDTGPISLELVPGAPSLSDIIMVPRETHLAHSIAASRVGCSGPSSHAAFPMNPLCITPIDGVSGP